MPHFLNLIFGDPNKKAVEQLRREAERVAALEPDMRALSDDALRGKTAEFRARLAKGEKLDRLVPEAFAAVREVSRRVLGQRQFDVQIMGGLALHQGGIAEMRTGEGKTLTAVAPLYVNALSGEGCHLVTVNDYLARRDGVWMGRVFHALGMSVGVISHEDGYVFDPGYTQDPAPADAEGGETDASLKADSTDIFKVHTDFLRPAGRRAAYAADVTYGTNNEFGFDYLRDNMAPSAELCVMRAKLHYAIVDEVDSILIDEARTPLIISAPAEQSDELYRRMAAVMPSLKKDVDYHVDEKMRAATFTAEGIAAVEKAIGVENLYAAGSNLQYYAETALRAHALFDRDVHYVLRGGEVVIVDEFTGRLMPGRRYSEGLHQAIEAKEGVEIQRESRTLATVTFQNFFRLYGKLSGMTGTAATEAEEFSKIYELEVTSIPTNLPPDRTDLSDRVYTTEPGKLRAVVADVKERHAKGQPVLIGTVSIEKNELLGELLKREGIPFSMLNAKNHEKEGEVIAQAGRKGAVTLATNMAGRGVDIILGGNPCTPAETDGIRALGGLHVIGTERHESRRIDNQLRGRAGRQGDPGSTQFYVSMEDDLMRIFGGDRTKGLLQKLGVGEDMPIESGMVTKSIEQAQQRVEGHNFDIRKHLLEYDDVLNKHREVIYARRREVLDAFDAGEPMELKEKILELMEEEIEQVVGFHTGERATMPAGSASAGGGMGAAAGDAAEILRVLSTIAPINPARRSELEAFANAAASAAKDKGRLVEARTKLVEAAMADVRDAYAVLDLRFPERAVLRAIERAVMLRAIDTLWIDHLAAMGALRMGIGLRGYGQLDPLAEYKKESYGMFQRLLSGVNQEIVYSFFVTAHHAALQAAQEALQRPVVPANAALQGAPTTQAEMEQQEKQLATGEHSSPPAKPVLSEAEGGGLPAGSMAAGGGVVSVNQGLPPNVDLSKVGRNDPCPCGAKKEDGTPKKFKHCHGRNV